MRWWDLAAATRIEHAAFAGRRPWSAEQLWAELAGVPDRRRYVVAETAAGAVVGFAGASLGPDSADVMTIAVHPDHQGRGVGHLLLDGLLRQVDAQHRPVFLEVRADHDTAIALYVRAGFAALATRRDYYGPGVDGLVMRRRAQ